MYNGFKPGMIRKLARGILVAVLTLPLMGLSQDVAPEASRQDTQTVRTMPPRTYSINADGDVIEIDFPDLPRVPQVYLSQDELESVPVYIQELEEAIERQQYNMELDVHDLELDAFDLEMEAYDLQNELFYVSDFAPDVDYPLLRAQAVSRAQRARVAGQDPEPSVLPAPKAPASRSTGRNSRVVVVPAPSSASTKEAYQVAYSLVLDEKWREAGDALQAFIQNNYKNRYTDDATFWFAYSLEKLDGTSEKVFDTYYAFVSLYPSSSWEDDAKANLIRLGTELVKTDRKNRSKYEPIMAALRKDDDIKVAISALYGLRRIGDESSLKAIINIYDETANVELRKNVVSTLARFEGKLVVDKLAEIAMKDPNDDVRSTALQALGRSDQDKAVVVLRQMATTDVDHKVRLEAVRAMSRVRGSQETIDRLIVSLEIIAKTDVHVKVRTEAVSTLGRIGTAEAQEALVRILSGKD